MGWNHQLVKLHPPKTDSFSAEIFSPKKDEGKSPEPNLQFGIPAMDVLVDE